MLVPKFLRPRRLVPTALYAAPHVRHFFIKTESTPNPASIKFLPGKLVLSENYGTGMYFTKDNLREAAKSPLAKNLLEVPGVKGVFLGRDFVTVTKEINMVWSLLKPRLFTILMDFFSPEQPKAVMLDTDVNAVTDTTILDTDDDVVAAIKELIETRVRPSVQEDGGDIFFHGFNPATGMVQVRLAGSCVGCPSSSVTLRNGVENMLMHYIPEVKGIEEVSAAGEGADNESKLSFDTQPV